LSPIHLDRAVTATPPLLLTGLTDRNNPGVVNEREKTEQDRVWESDPAIRLIRFITGSPRGGRVVLTLFFPDSGRSHRKTFARRRARVPFEWIPRLRFARNDGFWMCFRDCCSGDGDSAG
jgi:hypothetical protein